ncbi:glycerate kinase [Desertifilum sp. FACHB-1129]|uniref:Glycerate kinase n=1 Tax=Desertifilum tharense IPPAS B-1220 TaxID=1781255 RepID=A0A1E5QJM6_9CYAN|nr:MULTISPECIES: glycerate kinase [Desertifilum]MDA0210949.1 glycerate kinase [Cyanobacteria bacterium FC1]MBD2313448.1 glycerate kinase [Desertifilum sp. FACHB-1129]MBD2322318.1 glycerate kinase [Desertifilum sp. FACHB-866]MBD2332480.1 glycerate kinase [Desertifilum sp. FACHB-868]OEJ74885.1 glycerate kinase [Desertifilum tharense IPPAS B-1220]
MTLNILIAPSGFKESLEADEVADCIEAGILRVLPSARIQKAPLVDGGEGFTRGLVNATGGTLHSAIVTGPVGQSVAAHFGFLGGDGPRTAVLEMAAAAGLRLVPREARNPLLTTTYGVGELIKAALDAGAERILVGCGDSGTNDGGAGMAQALGVRLLNAEGEEIGRGGGELIHLDRIDMSQRDPRLAEVQIDVACNWHNLLCGPKGVARVFGPQKGASPETVEQMAAALDRYAEIIQRDLDLDVREAPGSGASGGLGTGLSALVGATLHPRYDIVMQYLDLETLLQESDLAITAEGSIDFQTPRGKIPAEVGRRAKKYGIPVVAIAGTIGEDAQVNFDCGIDSFESILDGPCSLEDAIANACELVTNAAERLTRLLLVGQRLSA